MAYHDLKLSSDAIRHTAHRWVDKAPEGAIVRFFPEPTRTQEQNSKMWPMLTDISMQVEHLNKRHSPEVWKCLHMHALGHENRFIEGLNGEPFPMGFRSSQLGVKQMSELIEWLYAWGAENNIRWSERGFKM